MVNARLATVPRLSTTATVNRKVPVDVAVPRSEEHTSELQSRFDLVCRLLLEKKKIITDNNKIPTHLLHDYMNIYINYFKAPWMPARTDTNPNEIILYDPWYSFH